MISDVEKLKHIGFVKCGEWHGEDVMLRCVLTAHHDSENVIYAFLVNEEIRYIGMTFGKLKTRMSGYAKPNRTQATNVKNSKYMRDVIDGGNTIDIYAFEDQKLLSYCGYHLNLASGLEKSLIRAFLPSWNGSQRKKVFSAPAGHEVMPIISRTVEAANMRDADGGGSTNIKPRAQSELGWTNRFYVALQQKFELAVERGDEYLEVRAGDFHKELQSDKTRMAPCCNAMWKAKRDDDVVVDSPQKKRGNSLKIRYGIPRPQDA